MKKLRIAWVLAVGAAGISMAAAQSAQPRPSAKANTTQSSTKPLTPKSAMPAKRKSAVVLPKVSHSKTSAAELARLEGQNNKAPVAKNSAAGAAKNNSIKTSNAASSGSGINATYQKPKIPKN